MKREIGSQEVHIVSGRYAGSDGHIVWRERGQVRVRLANGEEVMVATLDISPLERASEATMPRERGT